jgi:hypothetical protein
VSTDAVEAISIGELYGGRKMLSHNPDSPSRLMRETEYQRCAMVYDILCVKKAIPQSHDERSHSSIQIIR